MNKKHKRLAALIAAVFSVSSFAPTVVMAEEGEGGSGYEKFEEYVDYGMQAYNQYQTIKNAIDSTKSAGEAAKGAAQAVEGTAQAVEGTAQAVEGTAGAVEGTANAVSEGAKGAVPGLGDYIGAAGAVMGLAQLDFSDPGGAMNNLSDVASSVSTFTSGATSAAAGTVASYLGIVGSIFGEQISESMTYRSAGSHGKYQCTSSTPSPTINEKVEVTCVGVPTGGAQFVVPPVIKFSKTPTEGGKYRFDGAGVPWKCGHHGCYPVGAIAVDVEYNTYQGVGTLGGGDFFFDGENANFDFVNAKEDTVGLFGSKEDEYGYNPGSMFGEGSLSDALGGYFKNAYNDGFSGVYGGGGYFGPGSEGWTGGGYFGPGSEGWTGGGYFGPGSEGWGNGDGNGFGGGSWNGGNGFGDGSWNGGNGYGPNDAWNNGSGNGSGNGGGLWGGNGDDSSFNGGNWNGSGNGYGPGGAWNNGDNSGSGNGGGLWNGGGSNPNGTNGGSDAGLWGPGNEGWGGNGYAEGINKELYDGSGSYNAGASEWASSTGQGGYYDNNGTWHDGQSPFDGGHYNSDGSWVADGGQSGGYFDNNGNWHNGGSDGYYDGNGNWHSNGSEGSSGGYYDLDGKWHDGSGNGYYDGEGNWHDGANPYEGGHYDANGNWVEGGGSENANGGGYYDSEGNWHEGGEGYYDSEGNWHDASQYGSSDLDNYFGDNVSGDLPAINGINGMTGDITGFEINIDGKNAQSVLANGGYVGADGIIYDADGNAYGSAESAGLIPMEEGSAQLENVLAQGGWVDENGNVHDASGMVVGYVVPAGSLTNAEEEAFENMSLFEKSEAMLQQLLSGIGNSNSGEEGMGERMSGGSASGNLLDTLKATFGMANSADVHENTMNPQQMYDMAAKLLKELGYTDADIAAGTNYDKDSAYTEPYKAWDMNRITTLQKNFKIDTHIRNEKGSSMGKAAGQFGSVNATARKNIK